MAAFFAGKIHEKKEQAEKERDAYRKEAQRKANIGVRTKSDIIRLLRERGLRKAKDNE